jgi:anaerobic ribonucleoside-triphosphate reductase activating protein
VTLNVHAFLPRSQANGPGVRAVVWVQGCSLRCPGCFNPETHSHAPRELVAVTALAERLLADVAHLEGVSISGGEPLEQAEALLALLRRLRAGSSLSVLLFSGHTLAEIEAHPLGPAILACTDVLVAGRYDPGQHLGHGLRGSANQRVHLLSDRYRPEEVDDTPVAEVILGTDGSITASGIAAFPVG